MAKDGRPPAGFGPSDADDEATEIRAPSVPEPFAHSPSLMPQAAPGAPVPINVPGGVVEAMPHAPAPSALDLDNLAAKALRRASQPSHGSASGPLPSYPDPGQPTPLPSYPDPGEPTPLPSYPDPGEPTPLPSYPDPSHPSHPSDPRDPSHPSHPSDASHPSPHPTEPDPPGHFPAPSSVPLGPPMGAPPAQTPIPASPEMASPEMAAPGPSPDVLSPRPSGYIESRILEPPAPRVIKPDSKLTYAVVFLGALSIVVSAGLLVRFFAAKETAKAVPSAAPQTSASAPAAPAKSAAGRPAPSASTSASAAVAKAKPPEQDADAKASTASEGPEAEARAALEQLRDGVEKCVTTHIGVLPGTSKPVPASFRMFRKGRYHSAAFVWKTPVFHCTGFSLSKPQPFMIQWQSDGPKTTGQGVAWIDDDGDGKPDRSLSFPARFVKRNEVEVGDVVIDEKLRVTKRP